MPETNIFTDHAGSGLCEVESDTFVISALGEREVCWSDERFHEVQTENPVFQLFSLLAIKLCRKKEKKEIKETNAVHKRNIRKSEKYVNKRTGVFQP